jgi:type I restriction enzyme S subunit
MTFHARGRTSSVYGVPKGWRLFSVDQIKSTDQYACVAGPFGSNIASRFFVDDGVPVIRGSNLRDDLTRFVANNFVFISDDKAASFRAQQTQPGDLVFTCWGTIGQVGIVPEGLQYDRFVISNKQLKLRVDPQLAEPLFCFYYFASKKYVQYVRGRNIGGAVPGINLGILKSFPIALPSVGEQKRIVAVLSAYDDLIANNQRRIELLEQSARLLFKEWFVHLRYPGHEHDKIIDGVPRGWKRQPVKDMAIFISRGIPPTYNDEAEGIVINQKCIRDRFLDLNVARRQSKEVPTNKLVRKGDVLINSTGEGTLGRVAQVLTDIENCTVDSHVTIVRPDTRLKRIFFGMSLTALEDYFAKQGRGATNQTELSRSTIEDLRLITPSTTLMDEFETIVEPIFLQIVGLFSQNKKLSEARDLLLPRLMDGRISV